MDVDLKKVLKELRDIKALMNEYKELRVVELNGTIEHSRVVPLKEAAYLLGVSTRQLSRLADDEDFPPKIILSERCYGWRLSKLNEYIEGRMLIGATL